MPRRVYRFDRFELDPEDRRLTRDGATVEVSGRYLDALVLMVSEPGRLVTKERFLDEVWKGVPVTDEALSQAIRSLRRALGDEAARPRMIETAPKHGYRFIAPLTVVETDEAAGAVPAEAAAMVAVPSAVQARRERPLDRVFEVGRAGTLGGGAAGVVGGLVYGALGVLGGEGAGASGVLVMICVTALVGLAGGAGVGFGIAAGERAAGGVLGRIGGGLVGGLLVGAVVRLLGLDAFELLFGQAPGAITGAMEGAVLGGAVGVAVVLGDRIGGVWKRRAVAGGLVGGVAGVGIVLIGGRLLVGSLQTLAQAFPDSRLTLEPVGALFGEPGLGPVSHAAASGLEGMLFAGCVAAAIALTRRSHGSVGTPV
ncbi:winged helix-turn-helix domain-containing protein [Brevundimonas bacteroides]|uniref:winged helix-turn-helix domain-containing protein n=1 Tax=Brevundimonas bacteroides TaxID=74311 RepID=UPI00068E0E16|nr:winged helix-turn-helix domain-containing protein [Brevundimonas bacteroides]